MARRQPGQLETAVLDVLWAAGAAMAPADVHRALQLPGREPAYTSVTTTLARLAAKGLLQRRSSGRGYAYTPTDRATERAADRIHELLGAGDARAVVLSRFVDDLSPADESMLIELLHRAGGADEGRGAGGADEGRGAGGADEGRHSR